MLHEQPNCVYLNEQCAKQSAHHDALDGVAGWRASKDVETFGDRVQQIVGVVVFMPQIRTHSSHGVPFVTVRRLTNMCCSHTQLNLVQDYLSNVAMAYFCACFPHQRE